MKLSNDEVAVICTIHQEPMYRFVNEEFKMASKMEKDGLLQSVGKKMFSVTKQGEKLYSEMFK